MSTINLNLARKWRSRNFDQVIGQELTVRILKNSLYLNHFSPLYLFSGQHGCGKTTTARIFATALNCEKLDLFQKKPKEYSIPCLECVSCKAMTSGNHPDFIEIDGASHTGVDNVRHIIDIASFLPLMGRKKIYLIDEAHMLSKAAFNAFLKILEEPPASVLFMLATTEHYKIIETVRSRSFQLFFRAVNYKTLADYLQYVCTHETIVCHYDALEAIAQQSKGSVRDALNILEQVRFEGNDITKEVVQKVLGHIDEGVMLSLFESIVQGDPAQLLTCIQENSCQTYNVETMWKSLIELLNACIWMKYGMSLKKYRNYEERLTVLIADVPVVYFNGCLKLLFDHELVGSKTGFAWYLFEMILVRMCHQQQIIPERAGRNGAQRHFIKNNGLVHNDIRQEKTDLSHEVKPVANVVPDTFYQRWHSFVSKIDQEDPLVGSIFKQARYDAFNDETNTITIYFGNEFTFFNDIIEKAQSSWQPVLDEIVGKAIVLQVFFKEFETAIVTAKAPTATSMQNKVANSQLNAEKNKPFIKNNYYTKKNIKKNETLKTVDISNAEEWKKATLLKKMFDGTVQELPEGHNE